MSPRIQASSGLPMTDDGSPATTAPGLTSREARVRLTRFGPNHIVPEQKQSPLIRWLLRPLADPMVVLLLVAGGTYLALGDRFDAIVILVAVVPIVLVSLILETRAERALERLRQLTAPTALVWRDGQRTRIPTELIVPGDLVVIQEGDVIPADGVLVESGQVIVDESALTGESQPVEKDLGPSLEQRQVWAGTTVLAGRATFEVTATGLRTRYGQVGSLVAGIRLRETPLQRRIRRLILRFAVGALAFCVAVAGIELGAGRGWSAAIIAGVSLAIAAIPEEFPMVYTLYLTLGAWRLSREHALVRRLASVETLGATTVICTDKTGTLTMGRVEVVALGTDVGITRSNDALGPADLALIEAAVLACEPAPFDPLDQAILRFAASRGIGVERLHRGKPLHDYAFDPVLKYMSHVWQLDGLTLIAAKGATEGILHRSSASNSRRRMALEANQMLATEGLRVVAVAGASMPAPTGDRALDESHLRFLGLIAFSDPLRPGVADALRACRSAGIRVIMVTGDHPVTAHAVAEGIGLPHRDEEPVVTGDALDLADEESLNDLVRRTNIFARIRPEQKHRLVKVLRAQGEVVAMTGDGINDAPALREADIGIAMGQRGTEVARESGDLVLLDDNFATIVTAVRDGRRIFENLRRAFAYLVAFHIPLLLAALIVPLIGAPLLLLPVVLIWLELVVHPTASLVFENDPPPTDLMQRPPRPPDAGLLDTVGFIRALIEGASLSAAVLALYLALLGLGRFENEARAVAVATLLLGEVILVLVERAPSIPIWRASVGGNRALPVVLGATILSLLVAVYVPPVSALVHLAPLAPADWTLASVIAGAATLWLEPLKWWWSRRGKPAPISSPP